MPTRAAVLARRPRGGGRRGRPPVCYTRQWALQNHHHPHAPSTTTSSATRSATSTRTQAPVQGPYLAVPTTHPFLVPQPRSRVAGVLEGRPQGPLTHPNRLALPPRSREHHQTSECGPRAYGASSRSVASTFVVLYDRRAHNPYTRHNVHFHQSATATR